MFIKNVRKDEKTKIISYTASVFTELFAEEFLDII
jgi:hypothetical protein